MKGESDVGSDSQNNWPDPGLSRNTRCRCYRCSVPGLAGFTRLALCGARDLITFKNRLAERVGFEPTERFPVHSISSAASSTTPAPLHLEKSCKSCLQLSSDIVFYRIYTIFHDGGEGGIRTHGGR